MNFCEMIKAYQDGTLETQQTELVKGEIEKHEAISDYLYESSQIPGLDVAEGIVEAGDTGKEAEDFSKMIRKAIRRAFVKMGIVVGAVTLAVVLAVIFLLPGFVSNFYYNPNKVVGTSEHGIDTERMSLDLAVFTELYLPGKYRDMVIADAQGYGKYTITIPQTMSYTGHFTTVAGTLERNELTLFDPNLLRGPSINAFVLPENVAWGYRGMGAAGTAEDAFAKLQELDDRAVYTAYFSLERLTDYESIYAQVGYAWYGVYNEYGYFAGFDNSLSGKLFDWYREKYPMLSTLDSRGSMEETEANEGSATAMKTHFLSMLRYMQDHPQVLEMFGNEDSPLGDTIRYVEENGLQIYGFAVTADKATILELVKAENIAYVYTVPHQ